MKTFQTSALHLSYSYILKCALLWPGKQKGARKMSFDRTGGGKGLPVCTILGFLAQISGLRAPIDSFGTSERNLNLNSVVKRSFLSRVGRIRLIRRILFWLEAARITIDRILARQIRVEIIRKNVPERSLCVYATIIASDV